MAKRNTEFDIKEYGTLSRDGEWVELNYFTSGDYVGSAVETANRRAFEEAFDGRDWWQESSYGYGASGIQVSVDVKTEADEDDLEALFSMLNALTEYPLIDEELHSQVEQEILEENWVGHAARDFKEAFEKIYEDAGFDEATIEKIDELGEPKLGKSNLDQIYWTLCEVTGRYPENESAISTHFYIEETLKPLEVPPGYAEKDPPDLEPLGDAVLVTVLKLAETPEFDHERAKSVLGALYKYSRLNRNERAVFNDRLLEAGDLKAQSAVFLGHRVRDLGGFTYPTSGAIKKVSVR